MSDLFVIISAQHFHIALFTKIVISLLNMKLIPLVRYQESFNFFINGKIRYCLCCWSKKSAEILKVLVSNINVYHVGRTDTT